MIRTSTVQLTTISAVAYRQKLVSGGAGITIWGNNVRQPGLASISKTSGEAIPTANTPLEYYPPEAFAEAIKLTAGLPYKNLGKVQMPEGLAVEPEEAAVLFQEPMPHSAIFVELVFLRIGRKGQVRKKIVPLLAVCTAHFFKKRFHEHGSPFCDIMLCS